MAFDGRRFSAALIMITFVLVLIVIYIIYLNGIKNYNYWRKRGIAYVKPVPYFGTNIRATFRLLSLTQLTTEVYWKYPKEKAVGLFFETRPALLIKDPDLIKRVLVTDFIKFYPRGLNLHKDGVEPMLRNLFFADGDLWRLLRQRMTPAFTSGKLKAMFPLITERAVKLQARLLTAASSHRAQDARELMARYTTDFIGACGFGLDADSLNEEDSAFRRLGAKIFKIGFRDTAKLILKLLFPSILKNMKLLGRVEQEIIDLFGAILKERNYEPSGRNDFVDLLLECQKKGMIVGESIEKFKPDGTPETVSIELDHLLMAAQVFVFFAAGFETSSSATSYTLHQLAYNPEVQKKVQDEVDSVLAKHDNKLSYDAIKEMTYLEWAFKEGLRMFPSLGFLIRQCARSTTIPELGISLDEGVLVVVPLQALHNDPQYWDQPEEFRPERFHPDEFSETNKYTYLPFGEGPRACIGEFCFF